MPKIEIDPENWLEECTRQFGTAPRDFSFWDRLTYLRVPKPVWLRIDPTDDMATHFKNFRDTISNGVVVWGYIIQANGNLFEVGSVNCPGEVVYSIDESRQIDVMDLQQVANFLRELKGTSPANSELLTIANYLTNERIRVFGLPVPRSISPALRCKISTTFFVRKHLPCRQIRGPLLPIIVNPNKPHVAIPLPQEYWPENMISWWMQPR